MMKRAAIPLMLLVVSVIFFYPVLFFGRMPIAADTIVGLYHPYRDFFAKDYPNGIPFKNFLITDPVRQQYPWRFLSINEFSEGQLPLWNPYSGAGMPLHANFQSAAFYPLNLLYVFFPFQAVWTLQVYGQVFLSSVFMFLYLKQLRLRSESALLGSITFSLSGAAIAWLEWNTITQTILWVPLILFAKERLLSGGGKQFIVLSVITEASLIFAGHLQSAFYALVLINIYLFCRALQISYQKTQFISISTLISVYKPFLFIGSVVAALTAIQWLPTLQLIFYSARDVDQAAWQKEGWFLPWQNLVQFLAPDFFGNPATLNYWGIWNYGEFVAYIGIVPLVFSLFAIFFRRDKKTAFFATLFFLSLVFSLPTFFAKLPYLLAVPFLSTSQPTRLLIIVDFSLSVLAALGFDLFLRASKKRIVLPVFMVVAVFLLLFATTIAAENIFNMSAEQTLIARNNLKLPAGLFLAMLFLLSLFFFIRRKKARMVFAYLFIILACVDLLRFGWKFTPFTNPTYLYPTTKALAFLKEDTSVYRIMTTDDRILPPNFSLMYRIASVDVYDPLYLKRYGEFVASMERDKASIDGPLGFNRIVTPQNSNSPLINLLGVKYVLSFQDISSLRFVKVFSEGATGIFENKDVLPRVFFVRKLIPAGGREDAIRKIFATKDHLSEIAIIEGLQKEISFTDTKAKASIESYQANSVRIRTASDQDGFLVFLDVFYPSWKAFIDSGNDLVETKMYQTDFLFRGIFVPKGNHIITFKANLL